MRGEILDAHRLEGPRPDVQRHEGVARRRARRAPRRSGCIEVQARGRRRHRAGVAREDALVALAIGRRRPRGGCRAAAARCPSARRIPAPRPAARCRHRSASRSSTRTVPPAVAISSPSRMGLLAETCASASAPASARSSRISTRPPEGLWPSRRAGDHARVVEDQQVIRAPAAAAGRAPCRSASAPEAPSSTSRRLAERSGSGCLGDQLGGQFVGEVLATHARMLHAPALRLVVAENHLRCARAGFRSQVARLVMRGRARGSSSPDPAPCADA